MNYRITVRREGGLNNVEVQVQRWWGWKTIADFPATDGIAAAVSEAQWLINKLEMWSGYDYQ